tara:strand:+ start:619 stop:1557 length:939 start_codon:yes stop_codon:yes gene_type:complete
MSKVRANLFTNRANTGSPEFPFGLRSSGIVTTTGISGIGIHSSGTVIHSGIITALNFVGAGNTFAVNGTTVDISISGGGSGEIAGINTAGISTFNQLNVTGSSTLSSLNVTGSSTFGNITAADINASGTLTYEDVTNVDAVGLVTARSGIDVTGGEIAVGAGFSVGQAGVVTATSFVGDTSDAISGKWTLGADGINHYTFTGPGLIGAENDPTIYVQRGMIYQFVNNMGAHPFRIQSDANGATGTQYNDGLDQNDVSNGTITWKVQMDAPDTLYYQCTAHPNMGGEIKVGGGGGGGDTSTTTHLIWLLGGGG